MTVWVTSGPIASGKTTMALAIAHYSSIRYCHIGNLLLDELRKVNAEPRTYRGIGRSFLNNFGVDRYIEVVVAAAGDTAVLDGLRLWAPMDVLRKRSDLRLVFRSPQAPLLAQNDGEIEYGEDLERLHAAADVVVPWQKNPDDVARLAKLLVAEA